MAVIIRWGWGTWQLASLASISASDLIKTMSQTDIEIQLSEITAESDADEETRPKSPIVYRLPKNELYYPPKELTWFCESMSHF